METEFCELCSGLLDEGTKHLLVGCLKELVRRLESIETKLEPPQFITGFSPQRQPRIKMDRERLIALIHDESQSKRGQTSLWSEVVPRIADQILAELASPQRKTQVGDEVIVEQGYYGQDEKYVGKRGVVNRFTDSGIPVVLVSVMRKEEVIANKVRLLEPEDSSNSEKILMTREEVENKLKVWQGYIFEGRPLDFPATTEGAIALAQSWLQKDKELGECRKILSNMKKWADHFWVRAEKLLRPQTEIGDFLNDSEQARQLLEKGEKK